MNTKSRFNTLELTKMGLLTALISLYCDSPSVFPCQPDCPDPGGQPDCPFADPQAGSIYHYCIYIPWTYRASCLLRRRRRPGQTVRTYRGIYNGMAYSRCLNVAAERAALQFWAVRPCYRMHRDAGHLCPGKRLHEVRHRYGLDFYVYGGRPPLYPAGSV